MNNNHRLLPGGPWRAFAWLVLGLLISACEAPLDLTLVEREIEKPIYRFDQLKAAASNHRRIIAVGDYGTVLTSLDKGKTWQRTQLPTKSSLISVASCEDGSFAAIDTVRKVWLSDAQGSDWRAQQLETMESPMAISCDPRGRFWIAASFSTLIHSDESQGNWREISQQEDMQFTSIQWLDKDHAVVAGEFGSLYFTEDGGESWERGNDIPNEFYPMAAWFRTLDEGWVAGLSGTILYTDDRGETWHRQKSVSSAPIYNLIPQGDRLYATGDNGTLLQLIGDGWEQVPEAPRLFSYLITAIPQGEERLLVMGGRGIISPIDTASGGDSQ
ncbi:MAG: YCF48-related protein [Candidatus Thiodiazotropha endolucinida]|uniref:YCF48-related protein n=1 Tax=Candidatus Thiodiazotropha taylori TaxID=2792791 RepID=A0A9E4NGY1_9GAMM|nr:YCF48-related protein [Candidatus Thiodiazotropha taylori]MCW4234797.1 YCF48-related protein [Candidatus Thiodiazotropha endolucinida]